MTAEDTQNKQTKAPAVPPTPGAIKRRAWLWCLLWMMLAVFGFYQMQHHFLTYWDYREPLALSLDAYLDFRPRDRLLTLSHCSINYTEAWQTEGGAADEVPLLLVPVRRDHDSVQPARIVLVERGRRDMLALTAELEAQADDEARETFLQNHYNELFREETITGWLTPASAVPGSLQRAFEAADADIAPDFVMLERDWHPGLKPFRLWLWFTLAAGVVGWLQLKWGAFQVRRLEQKLAAAAKENPAA